MATDDQSQVRLARPDVTKAQAIAIVQAVIAVAVAFGVPISDNQSVALLGLAGLIGTVLLGADLGIRRGRAEHADKLVPQASITTTAGSAGGETTTQVTAPIPEGQDDALDAEIVELFRRLVRQTQGLATRQP
jgi:hypothetical protein